MSNYEADSNNSNSKRAGLITALIIALLAAIGLGGYFWKGNKDMSDMQLEAKRLIEEKNQQITQMQADLSIFKGRNTQLDSLIVASSYQLELKSKSLDSMIRVGKISRQELSKFKSENARLGDFKKRYLAQIDSLIRANESLKLENTGLKTEVADARNKNEKITQENVDMFNRLSTAAILKATTVVSQGVRFRSSGKELDSKRSRNVEKIKTCFTLQENRVSQKGYRDVIVRIIDPSGVTLYVEEEGSGRFLVEGSQALYTKKASIDYQGTDTPVCIYFAKGSDYAEGNYKIEVYSDGYKIGEGALELK